MTITADTSPCCIAAFSSSSDPTCRLSSVTSTNACLTPAEAVVPSWSTKPTEILLLPLPPKIQPNRKTNMTGKKIVQKRAARSRTRLLTLATVRMRSVFIVGLLVAQRSTGQVEEDVFERGLANAQVAGLDAEFVGHGQQGTNRARDVFRVEHRLALFLRRASHADELAQCLGRQGGTRVEEDRSLLEASPDQLRNGAHLEDVAVIHDGHAVAQLGGLFHVVRRQHHRLALRLEPLDQVPERASGLGVQAGRRLVEEDQFRVVDQGQSDRQALLLAAGEVHGPRVCPLAEIHRVDQLFGGQVVLEEAAEQVQQLCYGEAGVQIARES